MTREKAIKQLKIELSMWESDCKSYHKTKDALDMAINALDKCDKIEQIINDWNDTPWATSRTIMQATLSGIANVLEKEEVEE